MIVKPCRGESGRLVARLSLARQAADLGASARRDVAERDRTLDRAAEVLAQHRAADATPAPTSGRTWPRTS